MALQTVELCDDQAGSRARIAVDFGLNCYDFAVQHQDRLVQLIWSEAGFEAGEARASGSGIPILFPFPGRIPGTQFHWDGKSYELEAGDGRGNAIHGFVLNRPWQITEQSAQSITARFHASQVDEKLLSCWPSDFCLVARYELQGPSLRLQLTVQNPDSRPLPFGLGTHPYFRVPLTGNSADACQVQLPVGGQWELQEMLPTGKRNLLQAADSYQAGMSFGDLQLDNVFCDLTSTDGKRVSRISDPDAGLSVVQEFDTTFRECVVYTPPHREAICVEPYTCLPGGFELQSQGTDAGIQVLAPGEEVQYEVTIRLEGTEATGSSKS